MCNDSLLWLEELSNFVFCLDNNWFKWVTVNLIELPYLWCVYYTHCYHNQWQFWLNITTTTATTTATATSSRPQSLRVCAGMTLLSRPDTCSRGYKSQRLNSSGAAPASAINRWQAAVWLQRFWRLLHPSAGRGLWALTCDPLPLPVLFIGAAAECAAFVLHSANAYRRAGGAAEGFCS